MLRMRACIACMCVCAAWRKWGSRGFPGVASTCHAGIMFWDQGRGVCGCPAWRPQANTLAGADFSDVALWQRRLREYVRMNGMPPNPQVLHAAGRSRDGA